VLCAVKDINFARNGLGGNQVWVLRHVARAIDLSLVVDLLDDLYPRGWGKTVAAQLTTFIVIISAVEVVGAAGRATAFGNLDCCNLKVVLSLARGVRSKEKAMGGVRLSGISSPS